MCCVVYLPRWGTTSSAKLHYQRCTPGAETGMIRVLLPSVSPDVLLQPSHPYPQEGEQRKFQFGVGRRRADSALFEKSLEVDSWSDQTERAVGLMNQPPQGMRRASPAGCPRHAVVQQQVAAKSNSADMVRTLEKKKGNQKKRRTESLSQLAKGGPVASDNTRIMKDASSSTLQIASGGEGVSVADGAMAVAVSVACWPFAAVALARAGATKSGEETGGICASS